MSNKKSRLLSRKDFLKKSSAGFAALSIAGSKAPNLSDLDSLLSPPPQFRVLGRTGIKVTTLGYGASRTMEPSLVKSAIDTGINFLDTGRSYSNGQNEVMVGKVIKNIRDKVIIQSKIRIRAREKGEELKSQRVAKRITSSMVSNLDECLKALQTDYIDIMLIHDVSSTEIINLEYVQEFFDNAKKQGKIKACGFSTHTNMLEVMKAANVHNFYDVIMVTYNHKGSFIHSLSGNYSEWDQPALEVEMAKAAKNQIGIVAMKTCSGGPYSPGTGQEPSYKEALKWIIDHDYIHSMAVAMGNTKEIKENIQVMRP